MKKLVLGIIMLGLISLSYAQYGRIIEYKKTTWNELKKSKLYVVYEDEGNSEYDKKLKESIDLNWKISEVEFINYDKYENIQKDESNFFLISVNLTKTESGRYDQELSYSYLIKGYKKGAKKGDISNFPQLAAIQTGDDAREVYIPLLIKNLNNNIEKVISGNIKSVGDNLKMIKSNKSKIKQKPLYVLKLDLNDKIKSATDIKKDYVGKVFVVTKEELYKKIIAGENINVFLTTRSATKSWVHVYNAKSGDELYSSFNLISKKWPAGIIPYHYKKWNK